MWLGRDPSYAQPSVWGPLGTETARELVKMTVAQRGRVICAADHICDDCYTPLVDATVRSHRVLSNPHASLPLFAGGVGALVC